MPDRRQKLVGLRRILGVVAGLLIAGFLETLDTFKTVEEHLPAFVGYFTKAPKNGLKVVVVSIEGEDLRREFEGHRVLEPSDLRKALGKIASIGPRVIGVDIDTADKKYAELAGESFGGVDVVWGRASRHSMLDKKSYALDVLGGSENVLSALVELPVEEGGTVWRYQRAFDTDKGPKWFLPCALMGDYLHPPGSAEERVERPIQFLKGRRDPVPYQFIDEQADRIKGNAVLFGREYGGLDEKDTPTGWLSGVELMAQIAETDDPGAPHALGAGPVVVFACLVLSAVLVAATFYWLRFRYAVIAGVVEALVFSYLFKLGFGSLDQTLSLFATLVVVLASEVRSKYMDWKKEQEEAELIEKVKEEIRKEVLISPDWGL